MLFIVSKLDTLIEIQSIDTDVLILLLVYIAMELVSNNDSFNLYLKLVTPNPTWYNILSLVGHLTIEFAKHYHIFTHLLDAIQCQALMEKVNAPF